MNKNKMNITDEIIMKANQGQITNYMYLKMNTNKLIGIGGLGLLITFVLTFVGQVIPFIATMFILPIYLLCIAISYSKKKRKLFKSGKANNIYKG